MTEHYPNTQVDDKDSILALIRGNHSEEEEEETKTEKGSPDTENVVREDEIPDTGNVEVEDDTRNAVVEQPKDITSNTTAQDTSCRNAGVEQPKDITSNTTAKDTSCLNDVVASLISKANTFGRNMKFPFPSFSEMQKMTEKEYEELQKNCKLFHTSNSPTKFAPKMNKRPSKLKKISKLIKERLPDLE
jgi:hypothetical protein